MAIEIKQHMDPSMMEMAGEDVVTVKSESETQLIIEETHVNPLAISFLDRVVKLRDYLDGVIPNLESANGSLSQHQVDAVVSGIIEMEHKARFAGMAASKSLNPNSRMIMIAATAAHAEIEASKPIPSQAAD